MKDIISVGKAFRRISEPLGNQDPHCVTRADNVSFSALLAGCIVCRAIIKPIQIPSATTSYYMRNAAVAESYFVHLAQITNT